MATIASYSKIDMDTGEVFQRVEHEIRDPVTENGKVTQRRGRSVRNVCHLIELYERVKVPTDILHVLFLAARIRPDGSIREKSMADLAITLKIGRTTAHDFIKRAEKDRLLTRHDGSIYLNPYFFRYSDRLPVQLYILFREDIKKSLLKWKIAHYEAAIEKNGIKT